MHTKPMRPTEEIARLQERVRTMEEQVASLAHLAPEVERLQEALEQLHAILECSPLPAPVFLRWRETEEDGCPTWRARFGKYRLEVCRGMSDNSWDIHDGRRCVEAGGGASLDVCFDEAEEALRRLIQAKLAKEA